MTAMSIDLLAKTIANVNCWNKLGVIHASNTRNFLLSVSFFDISAMREIIGSSFFDTFSRLVYFFIHKEIYIRRDFRRAIMS